MSIASGARNRADNVLEEGKSTVSAAQQRLETLAADARDRARSAVDDTRNATVGVAGGVIALTRRHAYTQLGAGDVMLAVITKRSAETPAETKQAVAQLIETSINKTTELVTETQAKITSRAYQAVERGNAVVRSARSIPTRARAGVQYELSTRIGQAKDAYDKLGQRGEQVATDLRHDPVVARVIGDADTRVERAANQVTSLAQKVRTRAAAQAERESAAATSTPVRPTAPRQVPAHRTIAGNTAAGEAPVSTIPTHRAAAYESETRKAAAAKAAETRQERAHERELAAQARSEAAAKAAATRKENAERAAAKRQAAAAKAAQTRKDHAAAQDDAAQARSASAAKAAATRKRNAAKASTARAKSAG